MIDERALAAGIGEVLRGIGRRDPAAGLHQLSGGASAQSWAFDSGDERLVLRLRAAGASDRLAMTTEAAAMAAARAAGVPAPAVMTASDDPAILGAPFMIMARVAGETIPRRILRDEALVGARHAFATECGRLLGALHSLDVVAVPGLEETDPLTAYRRVLDQLGAPCPTFEWAFRHLERHRPPPHPRRVVHGDFRMGNLVIGPDGIRSVLDWELVHVGDPIEDLGWLCTRSWRFGARPPVGGAGSYEDLIDGYAEVTGWVVATDTLRWWETLGSLRWGIMCLMQASHHLNGARRSVELAAIGRRVAETEWDLLGLLP